jgi:hypothetical protein
VTGSGRPGGDSGFSSEPGTLITAIVAGLEPGLSPVGMGAAITAVAPSRAQQRRLAAALAGDPGLLTSGRPEGPPQIELLIRALQPLGAQRLVLPGCAHCGQPRRLVQCDGDLRICSACDRRRRGAAEPCSACGNTGQVAYRDEHGRPRCVRCRPYGGPEPVAGVMAHVASLGPGLDQARLREVIEQSVPQPFQQHQVLWELDRNPRLLTGEGGHGSPRINVLIHALLAAGAACIVAPDCPACGRTVRLSHRRGEQRCCRRCYDQDQLQVCSRCQQAAAVTSRTAAGEPVCAGCFRQDPANHEQCASCGRIALTVRRDDGQAWCRRCYRAPLATCSVCGRDKACHLTPAGTRRCEHCSRRMRHVPCGRCGHDRAVWTRTADGQPLCGSCSRQRVPCSACGSTRTVAARIPEGPLCSTCYRKHPASFQPCTECGTTEHLYHHGLCTRCASRQHLLSLLADGQGGFRPHAEAIYQLLAAGDPAWLMAWLTSGSDARNILAEISQASGPPGHAGLDRHLPSRAAHHLRKVLVAGGILPDRDERLAGLERWAVQKTSQVEDPAERRILRSFVTWHHLRRLRGESRRQHITAEQSDYVHNEVRAAIKLITWLRDNGTSLADCTQRDIDTWLTSGPGTNYHARAFLLWASRRGHTRDLDIPQHPRREVLTQIEDDERWALVRALLHDDTHAIEDRVAGLLVLLYGQPLARIARLTRDQITRSPQQVQLLLGTVPLDLPEPLGELARQLLDRTHGRAAIGRAGDQPWAFPGGAPGHPLSTAQLKVRLARLGIHGRSGRNTALMDLAAKVPPVALARLLGINISTAGAWADRAGGSSAAYAAQVSRRGSFSKF